MNDVIPPNNTNRIYQLRGDIAWPGQLRILIDRMDYIEIQDSVTGYRAKIEDFS